ncbi:TIGR01777 family oxidoreductase [Peribacillus sp. SCS-37]|uniref:TIGR01777 family oxidoreductase n=1 Tax=Paraperibacillus esterisolvens TaxID=3115296 RepID=UPI0039062391
MNILIAGGTGFIGSALLTRLQSQGDRLFVLTRKDRKPSENITYIKWLSGDSNPEKNLPVIDAVINLSGESLNGGRWTKDQKEKIITSRIDSSREINRIIGSLKRRPSVLINASAVGIYGTSLDKTFDEESPAFKEDFLSHTVRMWETEAGKAASSGTRVVLARFGVILGRSGGALPKMILPYRLFAGGRIGSGRQWLSWIHIDDAVNAILFALNSPEISGPVNITSPNPVRMDEFGKTAGAVLHRPHWLPVPSPILKLMLGEMSMLVLKGQRAVPAKLAANGFIYKHPGLSSALESLK